MPTDFSCERDVIERLDGWVQSLADPLTPPRRVADGSGRVRLEFREHLPHSVMVGKCVRAVSGLHAALALAESGFVAESAALLRMVSDFCTEIIAIGEALNRGGDLPTPVQTFVDQYFVPKPRTPEEFAAVEQTRYVSREKLMKAELRLAQNAEVDGEQLRTVHRFLNMSYDSYVHGAYETSMELWDLDSGRFQLRGHPAPSMRQTFVETVFLKLHEVVVAVEFTAAVTAQADVFEAARGARHALDQASPRDGLRNREDR